MQQVLRQLCVHITGVSPDVLYTLLHFVVQASRQASIMRAVQQLCKGLPACKPMICFAVHCIAYECVSIAPQQPESDLAKLVKAVLHAKHLTSWAAMEPDEIESQTCYMLLFAGAHESTRHSFSPLHHCSHLSLTTGLYGQSISKCPARAVPSSSLSV